MMHNIRTPFNNLAIRQLTLKVGVGLISELLSVILANGHPKASYGEGHVYIALGQCLHVFEGDIRYHSLLNIHND